MTFATIEKQPGAWCAGWRRDPHWSETSQRRDLGLPLCDPCELARRGEADHG